VTLVPVGFIPIPPGPTAGFDHADVYRKGKRMVVVMHDAELERLYVAVGEPGVVCSFDSGRLEPVERVETELGAHTTGWDPVGKCLYVFCPGRSGALMFEERA